MNMEGEMYMPAYNNPYNSYSYNQPYYGNYNYPQTSTAMPMPAQQSYGAQPQPKAMEWVEGEIGAIAFQMPPGWPANTPIPLWDNKDTNIFLKSWNPMGVPNPLQKLHYVIPDSQNMYLPGQSGDGEYSGADKPQQDMSMYATKSDIDALRQEIRNMSAGNNEQKGNSGGNSGNRGGGR